MIQIFLSQHAGSSLLLELMDQPSLRQPSAAWRARGRLLTTKSYESSIMSLII